VERKIAGTRVLEIDLNRERSAHSEGQPVPFDLNDLGGRRADVRLFAAPRPNVYVAATSGELMRVVIQRMKRRGLKRALPPSLPEWQYLDTSLPAWGLRHYRRETIQEDDLTMAKWDDEAIGLVFFGGSQPAPYVALRYLSTHEDAGDRFRQMQAHWLRIGDKARIASMRQVGKNCVEIRTRIYVPRAELANARLETISEGSTGLCMHLMYLPWLGLSSPRLALTAE
jgi:hypothetical protein